MGRLILPIDALESASSTTGWNADSMLAVALDFIQQKGEDLMVEFSEYVAEREDEENAYGADEGEDTDDVG